MRTWIVGLGLSLALTVAAHGAVAPYKTLSSVRPAELIETFNVDAGHARLLVLLSPT